jgi:hypothetical protein
VNWSGALTAEVPPGLVTVMSTVPDAPAGDVAVMDVGEFTVKLGAPLVPNFTPVVPPKLVPVIVTVVPPLGGPAVGLIAVTAGLAV